MKHKILSIMMTAVMAMSASSTVFAEVIPTVNYEYLSAEEAISEISKEELVLANSSKVNGSTIIGMTESTVYDAEKNKDVRSFNFNKKAEGANKAGSADVRAVLSGFAKYMTDETVNTISFDYKITGESQGHIGMFLVNGAEDFGEQVDPGVLIGNTNNANIQWKINRNTGGSDWYSYARNFYEHTIEVTTDNRQWNRITLEINKKTGDVTGYMNGELFSYDPVAENKAVNPPTDMDSIAFQTAGLVANDGDLAILLDNIKVYPGKMKYSKNANDGVWRFETGLDVESFGIADADGEFINSVQSEHYVKTTLSNTTDEVMNVLIFISGYDRGIMESVDAKKIEIQPGEKFIIDNENNSMYLNNEQEYEKVQLSILDGVGYPLMNPIEIITE